MKVLKIKQNNMLGPELKASGQPVRFLFPLLDGILAVDENVGPMTFF